MYSTLISDIFTDSDEALYIILLENNAGDYKKMPLRKKKINENGSWTKVHEGWRLRYEV